MKIQYAIVKPELCAMSCVTPIAGIVISEEPLPEFAAHQIVIDPEPHNGYVRLVNIKTSLEARLDTWSGPETLQDATFHQVLTKPLFSLPQLLIPAGEVALVATDLPGTPDGHHAYAMFGLIGGTDKHISAIAEKVYESRLSSKIDNHLSLNPSCIGMAVDTGRAAKHEMGNHLLNILTQPLWGFEAEKVGMSSLITKGEFQKIRNNREHLITHGKNSPEVRGSVDRDYVDFLRAMNSLGATPPSLWETQPERDDRAKLGKKALRLAMAQDNGPTL